MNILKLLRIADDNNQLSITNLAVLAVSIKVLLGLGSSLDVGLLLLIIIDVQLSKLFDRDTIRKNAELLKLEQTNAVAIQNLAQQTVDEMSKLKDRLGAVQVGNGFKGIFKQEK